MGGFTVSQLLILTSLKKSLGAVIEPFSSEINQWYFRERNPRRISELGNIFAQESDQSNRVFRATLFSCQCPAGWHGRWLWVREWECCQARYDYFRTPGIGNISGTFARIYRKRRNGQTLHEEVFNHDFWKAKCSSESASTQVWNKLACI